MEGVAGIFIGENDVSGGTFFIKDQKAVGTVENSALNGNLIFIDDEDLLDFFVDNFDEECSDDEEVLAKVSQAKSHVKKVKTWKKLKR